MGFCAYLPPPKLCSTSAGYPVSTRNIVRCSAGEPLHCSFEDQVRQSPDAVPQQAGQDEQEEAQKHPGSGHGERQKTCQGPGQEEEGRQ